MSMLRYFAAGILTLTFSTAARAQLPSASTRALGMGDNYTAVARGYATVSWNPALLALPDNPRASLTIIPLRGIAGLDPITLGDISDYEGEFVPASVREQWLTQIEREGSEQGTGGGDITLVAAQIGNFAVQVGSTLRAVSNISPGAAELILFGNYGRANETRAFDLQGSNLNAYAASTLAASYAWAVGTQQPAARTTIGVTLKYTLGHILLFGEDRGTTFTEEPVANINFPVVGTSTQDYDGFGGSGFGVDLGLAMVRGAWTFGLAAQNVINTFEWDEDKLIFRAGLGTFDIDTHTSDFDEQDFSTAPSHLKDIVADARFKPVLAAGLAFDATPTLTLAGDFRTRLGDTTLEFAPKTHVGIGAELRTLSFLPLRAGLAFLEGGYQIAGGIGLNLGPLDLAASIARRDTDLGVDTITMFTLISTMGR